MTLTVVRKFDPVVRMMREFYLSHLGGEMTYRSRLMELISDG